MGGVGKFWFLGFVDCYGVNIFIIVDYKVFESLIISFYEFMGVDFSLFLFVFFL